MVKRGNWIIVMFSLLTIFILSFSSAISAQDIFYSNTQITFLEILGLNDVHDPFLISQGLGQIDRNLQIPIQKSLEQKSCSGVSKLNILDVETDFPFDKEKKIKKKQPEINLSLEETIVLKVEREINKKKSKMDKTSQNKPSPKIIDQKKVRPEKILEKLKEDINFKEIYDYAGELGYDKLNNSLEVNYDDGTIVTFTEIYSDSSLNKKLMFLVNKKRDSIRRTFIMEIAEENGTNTLQIYDKNNGVIINLSDYSIISEWGHHSCSWGNCVGFGIELALANGATTLCGPLCSQLCIKNPTLAGCSPCLLCISGLFFAIEEICSDIPIIGQGACYYYPCFDDCNEYDGYYNSPWQYYCNGDYQKRYRNYTDFYCPSEYGPREGSCNSFNSPILDPDYNDYCQYGCSEGYCLGEVNCYSDVECGADGWVGEPYCSGGDVRQYYQEYDCHYPGTENSFCSYDNVNELKQECASGECQDGECVGVFSCPGGAPWECNDACWTSGQDNNHTLCCPDVGDPTHACWIDGPFCNTSTGDCTVCGGDFPTQCNNYCWGLVNPAQGIEVCCPESGDPFTGCNITSSVCMSDGNCCAPSIETCNNLDDNCDGVIDNFSEGCGLGICANGTRTCTAGNWSSCSTDYLLTNETCNNLDDNCDGSVDENVTQGCGSNVGECVIGTQTCSSGEWGECGGDYIAPTNETCNTLDDNCNNITDENNICADYPNVTLTFPTDNYISDTGNITFNCSVTDESGLINVTLYHNLDGNMTANETKSLTGTSDSATWIINNIPLGTNFSWNCFAYDNDSHLYWAESPSSAFINFKPFPPIILYPNGGETIYTDLMTINWTVSIDPDNDFVRYFLQYSNNSGTNWFNIISNYGYENKLNDSSTGKELIFSGNENKTVYLRIPKNAKVTSAKLDLTGGY